MRVRARVHFRSAHGRRLRRPTGARRRGTRRALQRQGSRAGRRTLPLPATAPTARAGTGVADTEKRVADREI
jgi:hypothetical protein